MPFKKFFFFILGLFALILAAQVFKTPLWDLPAEQDADNSYVGSTQCSRCHGAIHANFKKTGHFNALEKLKKQKNQVNAQCLRCHTTGFNIRNGYTSGEDPISMRGVGCETCHGPGKRHVLAPDMSNIRKPREKECLRCHEPTRYPGFSQNPSGYFTRIHHDTLWPVEILKAPDSGTVHYLDLFVMSHCLYGIRAEQALLPLVERFRDRVQFNIYFIMHKKGDSMVRKKPADPGKAVERCQSGTSMSGNEKFMASHGLEEVEENLRQMLFVHLYQERAYKYILARGGDMNGDWHACAERAGFSHKEIKLVHDLQKSRVADSLALCHIALAESLDVPGSPTLYVDGFENEEHIDAYLFQSLFCKNSGRRGPCVNFPECARDLDCNRNGREGICRDPALPQARCFYEPPAAVDVAVVNRIGCTTCNTGNIVEMVRRKLPGARFRNVELRSPHGEALVRQYNLEFYPAFVFEKSVEQSEKFRQIQHTFRLAGDRYLIEPRIVKSYRFIGRKPEPGKLDVFFTAQHPYAIETLRSMEVFLREHKDRVQCQFHVFAFPAETTGNDSDWTSFYSSSYGRAEIMEGVRLLCVQRLHPDKAYLYALCRGFDVQKRFNSHVPEPEGEWESCARQLDLNVKRIRQCSDGIEGQRLFMDDVIFSRKWNGTENVVFLVNNYFHLQDFNPPTWEIIKKELLRNSISE